MSKLDDLQKTISKLKKPAEKAKAKPKSDSDKPNSVSEPAQCDSAKTQVKRRGGHPTKTLPVISNPDTAEITDKEEIFCQAVVKGSNDSDAYRSAYDTAKMKPESVNRMAHDLRQNLKITSRIAYLREQAAKAAVVTESHVLQEAARIGFSDPRQLFDENGNLLPVKQWADSLAAAVKSFKVVSRKVVTQTGENDELITTETAVTEVSMWDKNSALEKLFKHMGLYEKDNKQRNPLMDGFARLPPEAQRLIAERLQSIAGPIIPGQSDPRAGSRVTH